MPSESYFHLYAIQREVDRHGLEINHVRASLTQLGQDVESLEDHLESVQEASAARCQKAAESLADRLKPIEELVAKAKNYIAVGVILMAVAANIKRETLLDILRDVIAK